MVLAAVALAGSLLASCSKEGYWNKTDKIGEGFSFPASTVSYIYSPGEEMTKIQVPIVRGDNRLPAYLEVSGTVSETDAEFLSFPAGVMFEKGQAEAVYEIGINKEFEIGQSIKASLKFDDPSTAGVDSTVITIKLDYNWKSLGKGKFNDAWTWGVPDFAESEFFQAVEDPAVFKIADPYTKMNKDNDVSTLAGNDASEFVQFRLLEPGEVLYGTTITKKDLVYFSPYMTGEYNPTYSKPIQATHQSHFTTIGGEPVTETHFRNSKVLSYQENGLPATVQFAPYFYMIGLGGWDYSGYSGVISIYFPGVPMYDYSIDLAYAGREIDVYDEMCVKAEVEVGSDVDSVMFAMSTLDEESLLYAMLDGEVPTTTIAASDIQDGVVRIPMNDEGSGKYLLMAITLGGEDEESYGAQDYNCVKFAYSAGGEKEEWIPYCSGDYTFSIDTPLGKWGTYTIASQLGLDQTVEMNLYQSSLDPTKWRLYPYIAGELIFYTDLWQCVYIDEGYISIPDYELEVDVYDAYYDGAPLDEGRFDATDNTFHLPVEWVIEGELAAFGEDTFQITGEPIDFDTTEAFTFAPAKSKVNFTSLPKFEKQRKSGKCIRRDIKMSKLEYCD